MAGGLEEITERVIEKLNDAACKLPQGWDEPKPTDPSLYSAVEAEQMAREIMAHGDPLNYLVQQAQRNHIGDTDIIKHLIASIGSTNSATSAGIQPELNGEKGRGKTDAVKAVFHLIPEKWKLVGSVTAKSLYYFSLQTGTIIFSDDVEWCPDLIATVKRSMGNFQEPQTHFTLDTQRNPVPRTMPARLAWWLSSVESVADDQLKDRQYSLDIDECSDHMSEVSDYLREARSKKVVRFCVDLEIAVARNIIDDIKEHEAFRVVIDCAEFADWKVKEDHRTQNKFWDLVEAFAILRYRQRVIDSEGWLHASVEDFNEAKTIFMRRKANHRTHLTNAQTKIVKSVIALQKEIHGATQARIAEDLGISIVAVSKSLNAIETNTRFIVHENGDHGANIYRCTVPALEVIYSEGSIVSLPDDYRDPNNLTTIKPSFNHDLTNELTNTNNNSNTNSEGVKPERGKHEGELPKDGNPLSFPERGLNQLNEQAATQNEVKSGLKAQVKRSEDIDIGPNPRKYALPLRVEFLKPCDRFVGEDLLKPGEVTNYGPYQAGDAATLPKLHATTLILKGVAVEAGVDTGSSSKEVRWS